MRGGWFHYSHVLIDSRAMDKQKHFKESQHHTISHWPLASHPPQLAWEHGMLSLWGCWCPWKARRGSARDVLWGCTGVVAAPGLESSPTVLLTALVFCNVQPEGNTWKHLLTLCLRLWEDIKCPIAINFSLEYQWSTHGGCAAPAQGTPVLSLP